MQSKRYRFTFLNLAGFILLWLTFHFQQLFFLWVALIHKHVGACHWDQSTFSFTHWEIVEKSSDIIIKVWLMCFYGAADAWRWEKVRVLNLRPECYHVYLNTVSVHNQGLFFAPKVLREVHGLNCVCVWACGKWISSDMNYRASPSKRRNTQKITAVLTQMGRARRDFSS